MSPLAVHPRVLCLHRPREAATLATQLHARGFAVAQAYSYDDAIAALARFRPHAIVADVDLGEAGGLQLLRRVATVVDAHAPLAWVALSSAEQVPSLPRAGGALVHTPCPPFVIVTALCRVLAAMAAGRGAAGLALARLLGFARARAPGRRHFVPRP
ncbi:MAG: hypothetical protein K1X88_36470, partial [Nannocystaceae bacterium]|nr:hypothetical protein [Nannocystaceae bacterium]